MENEIERNIQSGKGSTISRKESLFRKTFYHVLVNDDVYLTYIYIYIFIYTTLYTYCQKPCIIIYRSTPKKKREKKKKEQRHIYLIIQVYTGV